jgi:AcrR family transcriptional regulator
MSATTNLRGVDRAGPGRPRSAQAEAAILDATLALLAQHGLEGLSIEAVAAHAGVGKATIYRRWPSREEMVAAALRSLTSHIEAPDTGSVRDDLIALLRVFLHSSHRSLPEPLIPRLIAMTLTNAKLLQIFLTDVFAPRRTALVSVLERGKARGELRSDLDTNLAFLVIVGPVFQLALHGEGGVLTDPDMPVRLVDTVLEGIAARRI